MECGRQGCYLSRYCRSRSTSSYHPILNDPPHVQVITPVLKALVCLISYFCFFNLFFPLYLCTVKYTPKNIDDCINHWCYIIYYRCTWHLSFFLTYFTILILCFVFVLILLYMRQKVVNVTMISSSPVGPGLRHQTGIISLQQPAVCERCMR